jgi:hypothetical protein
VAAIDPSSATLNVAAEPVSRDEAVAG